MNTRRLIRLHLMMLLIILLPFGGFLWSVPSHQIYAYGIAAVCLVLSICIESIAQLTEREAKFMTIKLNEERADLEEWKEKVRELDRIVALISVENQEYRQAALDKAFHAASAEPART